MISLRPAARLDFPDPRAPVGAEFKAAPAPPAFGHNGGPPFEPNPDAFVRFAWRRAHAAAWRTPCRDIALFRLSRARAAGVDDRTYTLTLLATGRHLQAGDPIPGRSDRDGCDLPDDTGDL